jgi:CHAT domain-containing protein
VCPSGFWGLRHQVTVPTSLDQAAEGDLRISAGTADLSASLIGTMPETVLEGVTAHATDVAGRFGQSRHVTSRDKWLEEVPGDRYDVLYFLCHGGRDRQTGDSVIILRKPGNPGIHRSDLNAYGVTFTQHRPLVVLNACETAALEPDKVITLVEGFTYYGASAVIGTEITVFNSLAYEFGTSFLDSFVGGRCHLGEAVRRVRLKLLSKWNPLGLVYVAYGLADLHLARDAKEHPAA